MIYMLAGASQEEIEKSPKRFREHLRIIRIPADDPAIADLTAAELEGACIGLLRKNSRCREGLENSLASALDVAQSIAESYLPFFSESRLISP
jgi:hypothetical protein